jgi:type I restriction enzyme R subunit
LIPKLIIQDKDKELLDELLNSVDLSTYGLERVKLGHSIELDDSQTALDPQNPNPRGAYGGDEEKDLLDEIIKNFNERWFQGWNATPEEQKVRFLAIAKKIEEHPDYKEKYLDNSDIQNRELAWVKIINDVMNKQRRDDLEMYKMFAQDEAFKQAMQNTLRKFLS